MNNCMLVVDDLSINRDVLCNMFSETYEMLQAATGEEAVSLAKEYEGKIAVALLDIQLPGLSGLDILRMRKEKKILVDVPVIVITVADDPRIQTEAFRLGAMDYINKPFIREIVEYRVANASLRTAYRELNAAAEEKEQALRLAEEASLAKSRFLTRISHELRTPMNAIIGLTELLREDPSDRMQLLDSLDVSAHHLLELLNEMMNISEIEAGKTGVRPSCVKLAEFLRTLDEETMPLATGKGIRYKTTVAADLEKTACLLDTQKLKTVLSCLLDNAVKFTPAGGTVCCLAERGTAADGSVCLRFRVTDTGVGICPEFLPRAFDEFETEFDANTTAFSGVGLGLSICKRTVGLMGGTIRAESEQGKGSAFTVELPARIISDGEPASAADPSVPYDFRGKTFLIAEDNPINQKITVRLLEHCHAATRTVVNGQQAVDFFRNAPENSIAAVLMDIRMPIMDGLDAARVIRALDRPDAKTTPIIAVTANVYAEDVQKSLDAGMNAHLCKPVKPGVLYETIAGLL